MKLNANLHNYVNLLTVSNMNVVNIRNQDFTLDELKDFANFLHVLNTAYNDSNKDIEDCFRWFGYAVKNYESLIESLPEDVLSDVNYTGLDEEFLDLKCRIEDIACELVLNGNINFFSDVKA